MRKLYCFDFDGTLTHKDTMFLYLKFYDASKFRTQFIKHIPLFVLLKLKLADAEKVKKNFISSILKGESKSRIEKKFLQIKIQTMKKINYAVRLTRLKPSK